MSNEPPINTWLRDLLIRVDSVCSLVAHRGIDDEARAELIEVARLARRMHEHPERWKALDGLRTESDRRPQPVCNATQPPIPNHRCQKDAGHDGPHACLTCRREWEQQ